MAKDRHKDNRGSVRLPREWFNVLTKLAAAPPRPQTKVEYLKGLLRAAAKRSRLRATARDRATAK